MDAAHILLILKELRHGMVCYFRVFRAGFRSYALAEVARENISGPGKEIQGQPDLRDIDPALLLPLAQ